MTDRIVDPSELYSEGWALLDDEQFDRALEIGRRLERIRWTGGYELQAAAHEAQDDLLAAVEVLKRGIDVAGGPYLLFSRLGNNLSDLGKYQEALDTYEQGLALENTDKTLFRMNRGLVFDRMDKLQDALAEYRSITQEVEHLGVQEQRYWYFKSYHAGVLEQLEYHGELTELIKPLSSAVFDSHDFQQAKASLSAHFAIALWRQKEFAASNRWLSRSIELDRDNWHAKWLVREQLHENVEAGGTLYFLTAEGVWPASLSDESEDLGVFACFEVVAPNPNIALEYALMFVDPSVAPTLYIDDFKILEPNCLDPQGVYEVIPYQIYPEDSDDES